MTETVVAILPIVVAIFGGALLLTRQVGKRIDDLKSDTAKQFQELKSDTARQFQELKSDTARQFQELKSDTAKRFDESRSDMNRQFSETNSRLQHIETRIDDTNKRIDIVARDVAELRDRTGALEDSLSTFMNERRKPNAA